MGSLINSYRFAKDIKPFKMTINIATDGGSFTIPHNTVGEFNYVATWGDNNQSTITSYNDPNCTHTYTVAGDYQIEINGICESIYFNNGIGAPDVVSVDSLGSIEFTQLNFFGCTNMTSFTIGGNTPDTLIFLNGLLQSCTSLSTVNDFQNLKTANVTTMANMFTSTPLLVSINLSNLLTGNVTTMSSMFSSSGITNPDTSNFDTRNVTTMANMFKGAGIVIFNGFGQVSNALTTTDSMFLQCGDLINCDISSLNMSNVTTIRYMFHSATAMTTCDVSSWSVSNLINADRAFLICYQLSELDMSSWTPTSLTDVTNMCYGNTLITTDAPDWWNTYLNITSHSGCFYNNTARPNYADIPIDWK